jgi:hypothetical protein
MSLLSRVYIGLGGAIMLATTTYASDTLVALATFGEATDIEMILIAKVSMEGDIAS